MAFSDIDFSNVINNGEKSVTEESAKCSDSTCDPETQDFFPMVTFRNGQEEQE